MSKNPEHIDEIFRDAIGSYEKTPPSEVWKNLQAKLDNEDATAYRRKYIAVKRVAIILFVLLISFALFETSVNNKGPLRMAGKNDLNNTRSPKTDKKVSGRGDTAKVFSNKTTRSDVIPVIYKKEDKNKLGREPNYFCLSHPEAKSIMADLSDVKPKRNSVTGEPPNRVIAQTVPKKVKLRQSFHPYWTITAVASQEWAQYNLENDIQDSRSGQQTEKVQIAQREKHEPSFTAGVLASYQFKRNWGIQTGLLYSNTAIAIDPQTIYAAKETNGMIAYKYNLSSGYAFVNPTFGASPVVGDSMLTSSAQHNLQCLSLPFIVRYKIEKGKFSISPGFGMTANLITGATIKTEVEDALNREKVTINKLEGTKNFYFGLMANAEIRYDLCPTWCISLMPGFRYALTPITKNSVVKTYPYSFGAGMGITYKF